MFFPNYARAQRFWTFPDRSTELNTSVAQTEHTAHRIREDEDITCAHQEVEVHIGDP
jgi:hypothetical protein